MKTLKILGLGACLLSSSVMAQIVVEAETAALLNGNIQIDGTTTALGSIKAIDPAVPVVYNATATWAEFTDITIPTAGDYHFITKTATFRDAATIEVFVNGTSKGVIAVPFTGGWQNYVDSSPLLVTLPAGTIKVKLGFGATNSVVDFLMNIDKFTITKATGLKKITIDDIKILVNKQLKSLKIESEKYPNAEVKLIDITGVSIQTVTMSNGCADINISNLNKGIYIIQLTVDGQYYTQTIAL